MPASMPVLSVVIPAYNERLRLPRMLEELVAGAGGEGLPATEFVVSDDGSAPDHAAAHAVAVERAAAALAGGPHRIRLVTAPRNAGKGAAIRRGWANADPAARWLGFVDADGAVPGREFWRLAARVSREGDRFDTLAGSRIRMAGRQIERSLFRHLQGRVFATMTEQLFRLGFYDTQCGVKLVRADVLRPFLALLGEDRWLLDLEVLYWVKRAGGRCVEEPIDWADPGGSKVVFLVDPLKMFWGAARLKRRLDRLAPPVPLPAQPGVAAGAAAGRLRDAG